LAAHSASVHARRTRELHAKEILCRLAIVIAAALLALMLAFRAAQAQMTALPFLQPTTSPAATAGNNGRR
jgi:hypothetical protein